MADYKICCTVCKADLKTGPHYSDCPYNPGSAGTPQAPNVDPVPSKLSSTDTSGRWKTEASSGGGTYGGRNWREGGEAVVAAAREENTTGFYKRAFEAIRVHERMRIAVAIMHWLKKEREPAFYTTNDINADNLVSALALILEMSEEDLHGL